MGLCRNMGVFCYLLLASSFVSVEASSTSTAFRILQRNATSADPGPLDCTTDFSNDYYGFGVRMGVYFSWFSSYFANLLLPSEIAGALDTNSIFLLALMASLFNGTHLRQIQQIDALIIMQLCSGFLFSSLSIWGYRTSYYQKEGPAAIKRFGGWGTHCRLLLTAGISIYGAWFWWEGVRDGLITSDNPECQKIFTWFFAYLLVRGGIDKFYIVITICCSIYYSTMLVAAIFAIIVKGFRTGLREKLVFETGFSASELKFLFKIFRVFNLFWILFCLLMVEMTLNKNHMRRTIAQDAGIRFPSQLLPLLIGGLSFIRVLWLIYAKGRDRVKEASKNNNERFERREIITKPSLRNGYGLGLAFLKILSPSRQPHDVPIFALEEESLPAFLGPWHHRYLVALLPWLSTFDSWKMKQRNDASLDTERASPTDAGKKFGEKVKVDASSNIC